MKVFDVIKYIQNPSKFIQELMRRIKLVEQLLINSCKIL